jgi:hypothetical protein
MIDPVGLSKRVFEHLSSPLFEAKPIFLTKFFKYNDRDPEREYLYSYTLRIVYRNEYYDIDWNSEHTGGRSRIGFMENGLKVMRWTGSYWDSQGITAELREFLSKEKDEC